jgi:hypothetical protein
MLGRVSLLCACLCFYTAVSLVLVRPSEGVSQCSDAASVIHGHFGCLMFHVCSPKKKKTS